MTLPIPDTATRVAEHTPGHVNQQIQFHTEASLIHFAQRLDDIEARLHDLRDEWDIERALQTSAGVVISGSLLLGLFKKRWRVLSMLAAAFLLSHAVDGWCPPLPLLRRFGVRTTREINRERYGLKALRGDFAGSEPQAPGSPADKAQIAAAAVSPRFNPFQSTAALAYEEPINVP